MRRIISALLLVCAPMPSFSHPVDLSDQEIDTILVMANECLKTQGMQCADAAVYLRNKLNEARKSKPAPDQKAP